MSADHSLRHFHSHCFVSSSAWELSQILDSAVVCFGLDFEESAPSKSSPPIRISNCSRYNSYNSMISSIIIRLRMINRIIFNDDHVYEKISLASQKVTTL